MTNELLIRDRSLSDSVTKIRVAMLGAKGVGKTSIAQKYVNRSFSAHNKEPIEGVFQKRVGRYEIEIRDISVDDVFPKKHLGPRVLSCDAFVLVYAVDDDASFDYLTDLREKIILKKGENVPIVVAGNKSDLSIRQVHSVMADCIVSIDWEHAHFEVAAKTNHNINKIFQKIINHALFQQLPDESEVNMKNWCSRKRSNSVSFQFSLRRKSTMKKQVILEEGATSAGSTAGSTKRTGFRSRLFNFFHNAANI